MTFGDEKMRLIKQSQLLKIKSQIPSNLFNEKYGLRLGEFKNTTGTERINRYHCMVSLLITTTSPLAILKLLIQPLRYLNYSTQIDKNYLWFLQKLNKL